MLCVAPCRTSCSCSRIHGIFSATGRSLSNIFRKKNECIRLGSELFLNSKILFWYCIASSIVMLSRLWLSTGLADVFDLLSLKLLYFYSLEWSKYLIPPIRYLGTMPYMSRDLRWLAYSGIVWTGLRINNDINGHYIFFGWIIQEWIQILVKATR